MSISFADYGEVEVEVLVDRNAAVAQASLNTTSGWVTATGSSKRNKGEVFDEVVARRLAVGRALRKLGRELEDSVSG